MKSNLSSVLDEKALIKGLEEVFFKRFESR